MALISGWGRGTWSEGAWSAPLAAEVTGVSATASVGSVSIIVSAFALPTGVSASGQVGTPAVTGEANIPATGIAATGAVGSVLVIGTSATAVTGVSATGSSGSVVVAANANAAVTGVSATASVGQVTAAQQSIISPTGVQGTTALGDAIAFADITAPVTGLSATSAVGSVTVTGTASVVPSGVSARALLPSPITFSGFGDAQISTAQSKFGGASLLLDGSGDYLESQEAYNFAGDPFTIDMWVRPANATQDAVFFDSRDSTSNEAIALRQASDNLLVLRGNGTLFNINSVFSADTWVHIAVTRGDPFGNTYRVFVNGVEAGSTLFGVTASAANIHIGSDFNGSNNWAGYIDELRVSNVDRYGGSNFTPPTSAYTADDNTPALLHFDGANGSTTFTNDGLIDAVIVTGTANVPATGLEATGAVGSVVVAANANTAVTGFEAITGVGQATVVGSAVVSLTGVAATGNIGKVTVWGKIVPSPGNSWGDISPNPGTVWKKVAA